MAELRKGPRGLPAVTRAREDRARRGPRWTMRAGLVAAAAVVAGFLAHTIVSGRELQAEKRSLLSRRRAVEATLGAQWFPMRDRLETNIIDGARSFQGDRVAPEARASPFRTEPGLYLRMLVADAADVESIRRVAVDAKKDAFAACLLREPNLLGIRGEVDGGAFAEQPWNLGQAYAATRILSDRWIHEVEAADDEIRLRVFSEQYEKAVREEIPLAIDVVTRARFFLLVLDEEVSEAMPGDGGRVTEEALQLVVHPARVFLFDLKSNQELFRLRRSGGATVIPAGERPVTDPETREAMQRQANNCSLATLVESAIAGPATTGRPGR